MGFRILSLLVVGVASLACASPNPASQPVSWDQLTDWSVHVVTEDGDGDLRAARIWLVVHEGRGVIRTGSSVWAENIERGSAVSIRSGGVDFPVLATAIRDLAERRSIDEEFAKKYGWQESAFIPSDRAASDDRYFRLVAKP